MKEAKQPIENMGKIIGISLGLLFMSGFMNGCGDSTSPSPPGNQQPGTVPSSPSPRPQACTLEFVYGVEITLRNPEGEPIIGAQLNLNEGSYSEEMQDVLGAGVYKGAGERPGNYTLSISASGYRNHNEKITVISGLCHVEKVRKTIELNP